MSTQGDTCFSCEKGHYRQKIADFEAGGLLVLNLETLVCDKCGDEIVPPESHHRIDREAKRKT